ncbi:polycystin-1-like [Myxocyprinus asiaticus]|uniref:polycystin-1-like n=1 Tax=Myxocyprinus asiaticus TaxID=70543 RepID=UPI0022215129|nr:polycystin-1-like [Myxocyprinus asiaticus]
MPWRNGQAVFKRKHGVCLPKFGFFSSLLFALCCLEALSGVTGDGRACSPCPGNCSCAAVGPQNLCVVNCSNIGLDQAPAASDLPSDTHTLDLSRNHIPSVDSSLFDHLTALKELYLQSNRLVTLPHGIFGCGPLAVLDLSNNQITTIEGRICDNLFNLTTIDLSSNPFVCDCKLVRLVSWLKEQGVRVKKPNSMLCDRPAEVKNQPLLNVSEHTCGLMYAGCLQDEEHVGGVELVIFSSSTPGHFSREECNSKCFHENQRYGGLGQQRECLCSTNSEPNHISESQCSAACSDPLVMKECRWTVAHDVFQVNFSAYLPSRRVSVHSEALLSVASSVYPVSLSWDFGDLSPRVNTSTPNTTARHKYGHPGKYQAQVSLSAGHQEIIAQGNVSVELPPRLELHCPSMIVVNQSLEEAVSLVNWGGVGVTVDWQIRKDRREIARAEPLCLPGAIHHADSSRCFLLVSEEVSWSDARRNCSARGGELVVVHSQNVRDLLAPRITQERGVWLGLSDKYSPRVLRWVDNSEFRAGEEGVRDRANLQPGNVCVSLDNSGQPSSHSCTAKRAFVCQFTRQVRVHDAGVYMVGTAVFNIQRSLSNPTASQTCLPNTPANSVELLLFPGLSFLQAGRLSSLELITQSLSSHTQLRFQVYRPQCPGFTRPLLPGCSDFCAPITVCQPPDNWINDTSIPPASSLCPAGRQYCPYSKECLPLSSPCHPMRCANCSGVDPLPAGTLYPYYSLVREVLLTLPPGPSTHVLALEEIEDLLVAPGDFLALQHDAGPSGLLQCSSDPSSPWKQDVLIQNRSNWWVANETLEVKGKGSWEEGLVCQLRVLYIGQNNTKLQGPFLRSGLPQPGNYSLEVTSNDKDFPITASCPIHVIPPLGLTVIHPTNHNGTVYFLPNQTAVLVRVRTQHSVLIGRQGSNMTAPFHSSCPQNLQAKVAECRQPDPFNDTMFAWVDLQLGTTPGQTTVVLRAQSKVTEAVLQIQARVQEPLRGLVVQPHPAHRVLMESVVSYMASVEEGTDPSFRWTVDDKPYFTYYNSMLNIIYQNAAVYKLTVTAMNQVSTLTEHFNVTVDRMNSMTDFTIRGIPEIVCQGSPLNLSASVKIDVAVDVTFCWLFGDGGNRTRHFKPPYDHSSSNQVVIHDHAEYVYSQPGEYTLLFSASNHYENKTCKFDVYVFSILTDVQIETNPQLLHAGKLGEFEAHPLPSPYGIIYSWNFGDNSSIRQGRERRVPHAYAHSGVYTICVNVNNTISWTDTCADIIVYEDVKGLKVTSSAPTERNTPTVVTASLEAGNNVTWSFDMGDGTVHTIVDPQVEYTYRKDGNYTVNVTAMNDVSLQWVTIPVEVFVLQVLSLEPAGCVRENEEVSFHAFVSGNASGHQYVWSFGDGSPNETQYGAPAITHSYVKSGEYHLSLLMSSEANKANFFTRICVQPKITTVSVLPHRKHVKFGEENRFTVTALPEFNYTYLWDFGEYESTHPIRGGKDIGFTYKSPGQYQVTVTVFNNISCSNNSVSIEVQQPVDFLLINHNGDKGNNLALHKDYIFIASSDSTNVAYIWDFGDGTRLIGTSVSHAYKSSGNFNISVTGKNDVSETKNYISVVVLAPIKGLSVNASLVNVPLNASVNFEAHLDQGDNVRYFWILCDRCTPILETHTMFYTFRSVGTFNIIVTAENDIGTAQASIFIYVQRELEGLQIVAEELSEGCCFATNRVLHLQASLKEGTNMTFSWNLLREPENRDLNLTGKTIDLNFSTPGPCEVLLKATNLLGQLAVNRTIEFLEPVRELFLESSPNPSALNAIANMTISVRFGTDLHYKWWADGELLTFDMPSVMHRFKSAGLKLVTVEVSNQVSSENVSKWIRIQEPISGLTFTTTNVTEQNFVASGLNVSMRGETQTGSNISWMWLLPDGTKSNQRTTSYIFPKPGLCTVALNATNDVSGEVLLHDFTVQDRIQGLELRASKQIAAVGENVEFTISVSSGTSVNFILSISGDATVVLNNQTYIHQFTTVAKYYVNLTAHNQVSSERKTLHIEVMEPVTKLSILDCCDAAIPVGVTRSYVASTPTREPLTFLWTFDLHHGAKTTLVGRSVTYTPDEPGNLTIFLRAFNSLNGLNVTKVIRVQNSIKSSILDAQPSDTFVNKTISFHVGITPVSTSATYQWDFGDSTSVAITTTPFHNHIYFLPGHYVVRVNVSNLVSWTTAQIDINISVLKCDEPEVQIIQAPRLAIWRYQPTLVEANVNLKGCALYGVEYLWEILTSPRCQDYDKKGPPPSKVHLPAEVNVRRLQLSVPKMSISAGNYTLVFSLSYEGVPLRKAACLQLSVMSKKLVPIIEGGTYRVWSKTQDLHLSAEQSYDPNLDPENQSLLNYHWECVSTSKGPAHCSTLNFGLGPSDPVLGISGSELEVDVEYTFRMTVSKEGMTPESTTQTVCVQSGRIPMVSLECVSCKAQSRYEISQSTYVYLAGTCINCHSSHRGRWTAMTRRNDTLVLDLNTTTTGSDSMHLVLRQGILHNGDSYIFSLHVTDDEMDREGVAYIELHPNLPPAGGACSLWADGEGPQVRTLLDRVHFNCSGYADLDEMESPLVYSLLVARCSGLYCEEFCVYKGTSPEHSAFLPPGFSKAQDRVSAFVMVEDHQGASVTAINMTIEVVLPQVPEGFSSLPHWLSNLTDSNLRELLRQGDSQRVRELSLALITVLNKYEQGVSRRRERVSKAERQYRVSVRGNITRALTSLDLTTVNDIQQTSAALAQCTAVSREFVCEECQNSTLDKLESMLEILQTDTKQGTVTPTEIADNILTIMGDLIHQVSQATSSPPPEADDHYGVSSQSPFLFQEQQHHLLRVAAKAYSLSSVLMRILMLARVLNEEPLIFRGAEIRAAGKRADPQSLLCYGKSDAHECRHFSIPRAFNTSLGRAAGAAQVQGANSEDGIVQLLFQMEPNPFPFNYVANYTVSTEVASMEFRTVNGTQIPILDLDESQAITVAVNNGSMAGLDANGMEAILPPAGAENISRCSSVIVRVSTRNANNQAGIYVQLNFTVIDDSPEKVELDPWITAYLHTSEWPNEFNSTDRKRITLSMTRGRDLDHRRYTFFLSPNLYDTTRDHFINVSTSCGADYPNMIRLEVAVFTSLCQYFSESAKQWRTDGMIPLPETSVGRAVCRTRHLTAFAASLFVAPDAVSFIIPERSVGRSLVVVLVCVIGLLCYVVAGAILRKLDQMDLRRASVVPLCGKDGLYKYEIQVKTGWGYGAGTTAHVGISLHGSESRSGHRHLDSVGAFARNSLDIFHIATDTSLGSVLKIRVWHDNKGLSPAWLLQYVLVKDLQSGSSYFFLVEEWLSVDNEKTDGRVEIEVEASEEADLRHWPRLLTWELQRAMCESHVWVSLWERPPRSPFTRLQRVTCCSVLMHLCMLANTVWYGTVAYGNSSTPVSTQVSLNEETVWAGLVSCLLVYPVYLLIFCLFRLSRSKVSVEQLPPQVDQESLEIDDFLDNSLTGSSFLMFNGISGETYSEETNIDLPTPSTKSLQRWSVPDCDWPDVLTDPSVEMGPVFPPRLKRGQGSRHLGVDITFNPDDDDTVCHNSHRNKYFSSSDEDLIKRILADGQLLSQTDSDMGDLSSIFGDKTEVILLQKMNEPVLPAGIRRDPPKTAFTSRTVVTDVCRPRPFPPLCGLAALWGSWVGLILSSSLSMWLGRSFSEGVALMWLISCIVSFLSSFLIFEPLKVLLEGVYFSLFVHRLRAEEQDVLVDCPRVERVVQRIPRVRPPQGFALSHAREEACKVRLLHTMLKGFLIYMLFLLVVLLLNYSDSAKDAHRLRLQTQLQNYFHTQHFNNISSREDVWAWLSDSLLPRLLDGHVLMKKTGSLLLGQPRLRQLRTQPECPISGYFPSSSWFGCVSGGWAESDSGLVRNWSVSTAHSSGVWHWGQVSVYSSAGFVQNLSRKMQDSRNLIKQLSTHQWLDPLTRVLFVEFSLYNINTDLLAVFSFLLEFPVSERAQLSLDLKTCSLHTLSHGMDLSLFLTLLLLVFVIYFAAREGAAARKQGRGYFLRLWNIASVCSLVLAICVASLHISRSVLSARQWKSFLKQRDAFTDFFPLAQQSQVLTQLSATLLFLLVLKASHQLRFMREWGVFGRTLRRSFWELLMVAVTLLVFLLAYSHTGHLLFQSVMEGYGTVSSTCVRLLGSGGRGLLSWRPDSGSSPCSPSCAIFHITFTLLRLVLLWLLISALLRNYRRAKAEMYRPAVDLQDYEMVELFLRRLKMWMGLSRAKEFRHKVRFEGMELPPSRSSSTSDCKSLCLPPLDTPEAPPTPDSVDGGSEASWRPTSSSPCSLAEAPGLGLGLTLGLGVVVGGQGWKERAEMEATLHRILPAFDALLLQLDRVNYATEELYRKECRLERMLRRSRGRGRGVHHHRSLDSAGQKRHGRGHKRADRSTQVVERSNSPPKTEISAPTSERHLHKKDRRSQKTDKFLQMNLPTSPHKVDSSPHRTDNCLQRVQESTSTMVTGVRKTENDTHKVQESPSTVVGSFIKTEKDPLKVQGSTGTGVESVIKTEKDPIKVQGSPSTVVGSVIKTETDPIKVQKSHNTVVAGFNKTEKDPHKMDSSPLKAKLQEAEPNPHRAHKADKASHKVFATPNKVNPNVLKDSEIVGCAKKPAPTLAPTPVPTPMSAPSTAPVSATTTPAPIPRTHEWVPPSENLPSSVFRHPAHTTTNPTRKRKHKPPPLKNKVHPNTDRPISGHSKP